MLLLLLLLGLTRLVRRQGRVGCLAGRRVRTARGGEPAFGVVCEGMAGVHVVLRRQQRQLAHSEERKDLTRTSSISSKP